MRVVKPKFLTKAELREAALRELGVSKSSFDFGWIEAIEHAGRHDWYEPLRRRPRSKNEGEMPCVTISWKSLIPSASILLR
jgi:hypothetical protein